MPKQTKKPKYPKEIYARFNEYGNLSSDNDFNYVLPACDKSQDTTVVAIYKFVRMAKVTRTVKVE